MRTLCHQAGIDHIEAYYISRTYLTRHGAGPLPGEDAALSFEDNTNVPHAHQGSLRFAPLGIGGLHERCAADFGNYGFRLVMTYCDQLREPYPANLYFDGPTRDDIRSSSKKTRISA